MTTRYTYKDSLLRQSDLIPLEVLGTPITIIGAGAVGSWTALALVKMGFANLTIQDMDTIDTVNMNSQFYPHKMVGNKKATALHEMIYDFTGISINVKNSRFNKGDKLNTSIVISAVDSMDVRRNIFDGCTSAVDWFIDPRMGAESMAMYTMQPHDLEDMAGYIKSWHSDEDSVHEACTAKSTIYCANILAGLVAMNVKKLATKQAYTRVMTFDLPTMSLNSWSKNDDSQEKTQNQL